MTDKFKPLLYTTTLRNPERIKALLYVLKKFDGEELTDDLATKIMGEEIRYGLYRPMKKSDSVKSKWKSTPEGSFAEELLTDDEVKYMIENNPQHHKEAGFAYGFPSRFATVFDFTKELGFVYYNINEKIEFSELGNMLASVYEVRQEGNEIEAEIIHPEYEQQVFMHAMVKSQRHNPFVRVKNDNVPLILLLQVLSKLDSNPAFNTSEGKPKGISRDEIPLLIFWKNNDADAVYNRIVKLREDYKYEPSEEVICDICIKEIMNGEFKQFKTKSITEEYPDEYIRKMRITGLISLRGGGRFIDINTNEKERIDYILKNYSNYHLYSDERSYFDYMAEVDHNLINIQQVVPTVTDKASLLENWVCKYNWDVIKKELLIISKRTTSSDPVLRFLQKPVRFEFLSAIAIKKRLPHVTVIPGYKCDDTGLPTSTAGGDMADIECFEKDKGITVEVTTAEGRQQTVMEIWPIGRHLFEFKEKYKIDSQCIFIAPSLFPDSCMQIKYLKDTCKLTVRPYVIKDFINYLENNKELYEI